VDLAEPEDPTMIRHSACVIPLLFAGLALAQPPSPPPIQAPEAKAPLLFVRVQGPEGMAVTFLEAGGGKAFDQPVTVGLRPCFVYRLKLSGFPTKPNVNLYPSLEVRGTLRIPPQLKAADFPAPVVIDDEDVERALSGVLVTKVITLEDAEKTSVGLQFAGQPAQVTISPEEDPIAYAKSVGRPILIVRLGMREPDKAEIARLGQGMILYPNMKSLPPLSPGQKFYALPPELPVKGPLDPLEECLRDGGDNGKPVYIAEGGQLEGLDPTDTVAEYRDSSGRLKLKPSNTVCLCVPRFLAVRHETPAAQFEMTKHPGAILGSKHQDQLLAQEKARKLRGLDEMEQLRARQSLQAAVANKRPIRVENICVLQGIEIDVGLAAYLGSKVALTLREEDRVKLARQLELPIKLSSEVGPNNFQGECRLRAVGNVAGLGQVTGSVDTREFVCLCTQEKPEIPEKPLCLLKWASAGSAQVGDVVTFYIKYSNLGGKPIRDIAISDSLTGRLEYVPGSAQSDREAVFVTQENEAGSSILRWEIRDPLPPGQKGVVSFQAKVR
jgi:uncharacterized repeat protein (TIGR01451 family)